MVLENLETVGEMVATPPLNMKVKNALNMRVREVCGID